MYVHQIDEDQEEEEDAPQQAVNNLLSKELLQLSLKDIKGKLVNYIEIN